MGIEAPDLDLDKDDELNLPEPIKKKGSAEPGSGLRIYNGLQNVSGHLSDGIESPTN